MRTSHHLTRIFSLVLLSFVACLVLSATTLVQNLGYAINVGDDQLYSINLSTGATTVIGPTGFSGIASLIFGPDGRLYAVDVTTSWLC